MSNKNYTVYFSKIHIDKYKSKRFSQALSDGIAIYGTNFRAIQLPGYGSDYYQVRDLKLVGTTFTGVFGQRAAIPPVGVVTVGENSLLSMSVFAFLAMCFYLPKILFGLLRLLRGASL